MRLYAPPVPAPSTSETEAAVPAFLGPAARGGSAQSTAISGQPMRAVDRAAYLQRLRATDPMAALAQKEAWDAIPSATSRYASPPQAVQAPATGDAVLQRSPKLGVRVPEIDDPASVAGLETAHDYQWQDANLLDTVYDSPKTEGQERLNSLRQFLYLQKELELNEKYAWTGEDLSDEQVQAIAASDAADVQSSLYEAKARLAKKKEQLARNEAAIGQTRAELKAAQVDRNKALRGNRQAGEILDLRAAAQKEFDRQQARAAAAERNLEWAARKPARGGEEAAEQKSFWEERQAAAVAKAAKATAKLEGTQSEYDALVGPLEKPVEQARLRQAALEATRPSLKKEIQEAQAESDALSAELKVIQKVTSGNPDAIIDWKLQRFTRQLDSMNHEQLLRQIQALFDSDDGTRFPEWMRYAVIHLSGMRYQNAHSSWFSPQRLLQILKGEQIEEASAEERRGMAAQGQAILDEHPKMKGLGLTAREKKILAGSEGDAVAKKLEGADVPVYASIRRIEVGLQELYLTVQHLGDRPSDAKRVLDAIAAQEASLALEDALLSSSGRKVVQSAREGRQAVLLSIYEKNAKEKLGVLDEAQALGLLTQMRDAGQIPDAVWKEISAFTQLRLTGEDASVETAKAERGLKGVEAATPEEQARLQAWGKILDKDSFYYNVTGWRAEHGKSLSPSLTTSLVCDQLGSFLQHARGHLRPGGLRKNATYYAQLQKQGAVGAFFKQPESSADLPPGASIYWLEWSDLAMEPEYMKQWHSYAALLKRVEALGKRKSTAAEERDEKSKKTGGFVRSEKRRGQLEVRIGQYEQEIARQQSTLENLKKELDGMRAFRPEKGKIPDISNIVSPMGPAGSALSFDDLDGLKAIDGKDAPPHEWTYQRQTQTINGREVITIMRAMLNPYDCRDDDCTLEFSTTPNPQVVKQWLKFAHEATVMHSDDRVTITFDTSTDWNGQDVKGMGTRRRRTSDLVNNPRVLVGFAPAGKPEAAIDRYLKGYLEKIDMESSSRGGKK